MRKLKKFTEHDKAELLVLQNEFRILRDKTRNEMDALRQREKEFEKRMHKFREVCTEAWDVVIAYRQNIPTALHIEALFRILEQTDHLWEGFAGCLTDIHAPMPTEKIQ